MRKIILIAAMFALSFGADGELLYKKCSSCHGAKAERSYLNKVPTLTSIKKEDRIKSMKAYRDGGAGNGKYGMGAVMKTQTTALKDDDISAVNEYIETLK